MQFSIIIPCYKVEQYLPVCLESVLSQSNEDWEAIVVDDGSPDMSGRIADSYAQSDSRFRVIHQENQGLSAARNAAIKVAQGEYLLFLDSDDLIKPKALEEVASIVNLNSVPDIVAFGSELWYEAEKRTVANNTFNHRHGCYYPSGMKYITEFVKRRGWGPSAACFYAYKRTFLEKCNLSFPVGLLHEDELFVPKALTLATGVAVSSAILYTYRIVPTSIVHSPSEKSYRDMVQIADCLRQFFIERGFLTTETKRIVYNLMLKGLVGLRRVSGTVDFSMVLMLIGQASTAKEKLKAIKKIYL